jgi:hypothetical protein
MHSIRRKLTWWITYVISTLCIVGSFGAQAGALSSSTQNICNAPGTGGSAFCDSNTTGANGSLSGPNGIIVKVANIFAFVTGLASVFVILVGGLMYITASGDAGKAKNGRSAVIYACVGLVVVVMARALIGFVVTKF